MTNEHILVCLFGGGIQKDVLEAKNAFEIIEGYNHEVVFLLPNNLYDILQMLQRQDRSEPKILGHSTVRQDREGIKVVKASEAP